jgi:hypothetical protein
MILVLDSCETNTKTPTKEQITEIIAETIRQDSLDTNIPVCLNLVNRYIYQQEYDNKFGYLPLPPRNKQGEPFVFRLYKSTKKNSLGFNQKDSLFVTRQINRIKDLTLELKILPKNIRAKNVPAFKNNEPRMYKFLVPIFNIEKDFAIVEYDFQCANCGYGIIVYLRKINDKWIKIESFVTWTS